MVNPRRLAIPPPPHSHPEPAAAPTPTHTPPPPPPPAKANTAGRQPVVYSEARPRMVNRRRLAIPAPTDSDPEPAAARTPTHTPRPLARRGADLDRRTTGGRLSPRSLFDLAAGE